MDRRPIVAILASAVLFGVSPPLAKLLLRDADPLVLAGLLYAGAGIGLSFFVRLKGLGRASSSPAAAYAPLTRRDAPWLAAAVVSRIIRPAFPHVFGLSIHFTSASMAPSPESGAWR